MILKGYLFSLLYGFFCLLLGFVVYKLGAQKKYTRKLVHILVGFEWVILYSFFGASVHFLVVALVFTLLLAVSYFAKLTPMIQSEGENAPGTVYYGVAMSVMSLLSLIYPEMLVPFGVGVFATSLGDGLAGLFGQMIKRCNPKIYGEKSLFGSIANFVVSFMVALSFKLIFNLNISIFECILIAFFAASVELISSYGLDNITVTLGVSLLVYFIANYDWYGAYVIPIVLTPLIIAFVLKKRALTKWATAVAVLLDFIVTLAFGNLGFIILLSFLVGGVVIDKIKEKRLLDDGISKKGSSRDHVQVLANGFFPMLMAALYIIFKNDAFVFAYVVCLAEALSDTAASGFGVFSKKTFDLFKMKKCERGLSGGVSVSGTLASFILAFLIPSLAYLFGMLKAELIVFASLLAFLGVVFDTLLGSCLQVKYRCKLCGAITEREVHCGEKTEHFSGVSFIDNDAVNILSSAFSAIVSLLIFIL